MRNSTYPWMAIVLAMLLIGGCAGDAKVKTDLKEGYLALENQQFDQAMSRADAILQKSPSGQGSAEALYLRGRALEQKPADSPAESKSNFQSARSAYSEALRLNPPKKLEAYIRTSLANVAYFQDDYSTAAVEWTTAYEKLDEPEVKSWTLYRLGLCRLRQGKFQEADQIFANVQQQFPSTVPAERAREHQGARGFSVQFATFASSPAADAALVTFRRDGVAVKKQIDARGRSVVLAGPVPSYQQAQALKARYASTYPDAMVLP